MAELDPEIIKLNESTLARLSALDKSKVYVIEIDVAGTELSDKLSVAGKFKYTLDQLGIESIVIPSYDFEHPSLRINELVKYLQK